MSSSSPGMSPDVKQTGPRFLSYLLHWGLFGVLSTQVYMYSLAFPRDQWKNKFFVYSSYILEVAQTIILTSGGFIAFGQDYGNLDSFDHIRLAWLSVPLITGLVAFLSQTFYAYRIRVLADSYILPGAIVFLSFVQLLGAIASAVVLKHAEVFSKLLSRDYSITSGVWNGGSALCDVIIAISMTYYLSRRKENGLRSTQVLIKRIITLIIETGTATATLALVTLILTDVPLDGAYFQTPSAVLAKVYSNSMMVVLNSRMTIGSNMSDQLHEPFSTLHLNLDTTLHPNTLELDSELGSSRTGNASSDQVPRQRNEVLHHVGSASVEESLYQIRKIHTII